LHFNPPAHHPSKTARPTCASHLGRISRRQLLSDQSKAQLVFRNEQQRGKGSVRAAAAAFVPLPSARGRNGGAVSSRLPAAVRSHRRPLRVFPDG
jgi:hypothetical protein